MSFEDDVRQQLAALSERVSFIEAHLRAPYGGVPVPPAPTSATPPPPTSATPPPPMPVRNLETAVTPAKPKASLESRIGAQFLNRIGVLAVLIGVAWFLKLAFDRNWIGPPVRILVGIVCAAGLVLWSERFRRRGYPAFSYSLKALGTGIAYLSLWAAFAVFHLASAGLILAAMAAVTMANGVLAILQDSELLAMYALAGGLATPALLSTGHSDQMFLFSYLVVLNGSALALLARHPWKRLATGALLGTAIYLVGWTLSESDPRGIPFTLVFMSLLFLGFAAIPFLMERASIAAVPFLLERTAAFAAGAPRTTNFSVAFPMANVCVTWLGFMALFDSPAQHAARPWVTLALAIACLVLAGLRRQASATLATTHLGLGISLITVAIPLEFHGYGATLGWLCESLVLVILARVAASACMRIFAALVLLVSVVSLLQDALPFDWLPLVAEPGARAVVANMHFVTSLIGGVVFAIVIGLSLGARRADPTPWNRFGSWTWLAGFSAIAFSVTLLLAVSLEIHHYWYCGAGFFHDDCRRFGQVERRAMLAGFSNSAWFMVYGAGLMAVGFVRRSSFLRWQALLLLAVSIAMVFVEGVSYESQGYRVLSFLVLGVLLLGVSFAYQKDWLRLR